MQFRASTIDSIKQKKESMNSKSGHLKSGWRGKKNEKELEDLRDLWDTLR